MRDETKAIGWGRGMFIAGAAAGQARGTPQDDRKLWPILCCCGATLDDPAALRAHKCKYLP